jgi:hypothetical protein
MGRIASSARCLPEPAQAELGERRELAELLGNRRGAERRQAIRSSPVHRRRASMNPRSSSRASAA